MSLRSIVSALVLALWAPVSAGAETVKPIVPLRADQHEACKAGETPIIVQVTGVRTSEGFITGQLHDDNPSAWLVGKRRVDRERWTALEGTTELCFPAPSPGTYALAVYHDRNANRKLDKTLLGLPDEPFGLSNNPVVSLGPPPHEDVAFEVPEGGVTITVQLKEP